MMATSPSRYGRVDGAPLGEDMELEYAAQGSGHVDVRHTYFLGLNLADTKQGPPLFDTKQSVEVESFGDDVAALVRSGNPSPADLVNFDFNCSQELYDELCHFDEDALTLREIILKRVFERERSALIEKHILLAKIADLEQRLASFTSHHNSQLIKETEKRTENFESNIENVYRQSSAKKKNDSVRVERHGPLRELQGGSVL